jgi:hypothetical protein
MTGAASRADIVSSFTLIKGTMIEETYAVFAQWDFGRTKRQNLDRLREENYIGAPSATWLRDVAKVLNRRFDPSGRDRAIALLARAGCHLNEWRPLLLWHMTRDEFLLRDFLQTWLYAAFDVGAYRVRPEELDPYLLEIGRHGGITEHVWSETTRRRVAAGLLRAAVDFGLLKGSKAKEFASYHLPERSFVYLLHVLKDSGLSPQRIIASPEWRMFLMRPADVERELLRLHQFRKVHYEVAGSLIQLSLPNTTALEYAEAMAA